MKKEGRRKEEEEGRKEERRDKEEGRKKVYWTWMEVVQCSVLNDPARNL